ncbi:glycosyltransferase [Methanospirillum lacunae]|nr:glycosyltransferase [Methanospirillum lacunae]
MLIIQVNTSDISCGGAEQISWRLHDYYKKNNYESYLVVGKKNSFETTVIQILNQHVKYVQIIENCLGKKAINDKVNGKRSITQMIYDRRWFIAQTLRSILDPQLIISDIKGYEDFSYSGIWVLSSLFSNGNEIFHLHNLHARYFDLNALPFLSSQSPVIITLHDLWCFTGHCAIPLNCERWKTGCGNCPGLHLYPQILHDSSHKNWLHKKHVFESCNLYIATPSKWLMDQVGHSFLKNTAMDCRVIPNGVDTSIFYPRSKEYSRKTLGLPNSIKILLFVANGIRKNPWKDYITFKRAVELLSNKYSGKILVIGLGDNTPSLLINDIEFRFVPYLNDPSIIAQYYCAADLYVHPSNFETFSLTILEARACKIPVIASNVCAIPEQIIDGVSGFLYSPGDYQDLSEKILMLLQDSELASQFAERAYSDILSRYTVEIMAESYLSWYKEINDKREIGEKV